MIDKLRYWCHKILPMVYDDSLSYYEFLCKVNAKLNEVIDSTNELLDGWEKFKVELEKAWQDYKSALTAEWADYKAEMDLKYASLVGTVNTEINAMKTDISSFKNDITNQITTFETKVEGNYAEFTAAIEEKINAFITKYNAEIAKIPDEITTLVNAWWQNEENYNKLVTDVAAAIGVTLTSGAVTFDTVRDMSRAIPSKLPIKSLAVCNNYYDTDGVYTLWIIVSGDISDGVSRLAVGTDRTAVLLSERNDATLGLHSPTGDVCINKIIAMCKNNYKRLNIAVGNFILSMPSDIEMGSDPFTPLAIYGASRSTAIEMILKTQCKIIDSISHLKVTIPNTGKTVFSSRCSLHDVEIIAYRDIELTNIDISNIWWRDAGGQLTLSPTATDYFPQVINSRFSLQGHRQVIVNTNTENPRGIKIVSNVLSYEEGESLYDKWMYFDINGNTMPVTLQNNVVYALTESSINSVLLLARCNNFTETGKAIICEGNRNENGGASQPYTMLMGDIPSDIVYVNNYIRYGNTYALSDIPTTGSFDPARVMGVTHPIGYLRTLKNNSIVHGKPLTLTYPTVSYWTADEGGAISLSSDKNALYKVSFTATMAVSGQVSAGNVKISLKGLTTDSRTFTLLASMEYAPISFEFLWGTGGGFTVEVSSETEYMTAIISEAELLIERLK